MRPAIKPGRSDQSPMQENIHRSAFVSCLWVVLLSTAIKILLIPSYRSTDFEVHRNWLAITSSLPVARWYYENTSEWTLDYPPFFAWFEWFLSRGASLVDPEMLEVENLNYASTEAILFQRFSVIASDLVLFLGVFMFCTTWPNDNLVETKRSERKTVAIVAITLLNPGLLMVDHIHFQYNGVLLGMLLISVSLIRMEKDLLAGIVFASLLMFKHIFLYMAPLYFVYLLRHYCCTSGVDGDLKSLRKLNRTPSDWEKLETKRHFSFKRFVLLGSCVLLVFGIALLPIICQSPEAELRGSDILWSVLRLDISTLTSSMTLSYDVILANAGQVLRRLFPVQRGLLHAYWAPNVWALYTFVDKVLAFLGSRLGLLSHVQVGAMTGGLVQEASFAILFDITPSITAVASFVAMLPVLITIWNLPHPRAFVSGYHVHEKAILMVIIPLSMCALESSFDAKVYYLTSFIGHISLFPLLFTPAERITKGLLLLSFSVFAYVLLDRAMTISQKERRLRGRGVLVGNTELIYGCGFIFWGIFSLIIHPLWLSRLEFLPLMMISVYSALGLIYCWSLCLSLHQRRLDAIQSYLFSPRRGSSNSSEPGQPRNASQKQETADSRFGFVMEN